MTYTSNEFDNPLGMFNVRTRQIRVRIQHLQNDLVVAQHPFTKATIKQEIGKLVDEYVTREIQARNTKTN